MDSHRDGLIQLAESVWSSVLCQPCNEVDHGALPEGTPLVVGSIEFEGAWAGRLDVRCTADAAREVAAAMFATQACDVVEEDIRDAVGELANIIGGNLKALLPQPTLISLPKVAQASSTQSDPDSTCIVAFSCGADAVALALHGPN